MAISKRLRYEILRRDNHACRYCGGAPPDVRLTVDHVVPISLGGSDDPQNLVAACTDCNTGKTSSNPDAPLVEDVDQDAVRWAKAMKRAHSIGQASIQEREAARHHFQAHIWENWVYQHKGKQHTLPLPGDWTSSIDRFLDMGLGMSDLEEAVRIAMTSRSNSPFKYMCGVLYRFLNERQEQARQILATEDTPSDSPHPSPSPPNEDYWAARSQFDHKGKGYAREEANDDPQ